MLTTYTLDVDQFNALDPDQRSALNRYMADHLGPRASDTVLLEYRPPHDDDPSMLVATLHHLRSAADELPLVATAVPEPPALHRWQAAASG